MVYNVSMNCTPAAGTAAHTHHKILLLFLLAIAYYRSLHRNSLLYIDVCDIFHSEHCFLSGCVV